MRKLKKLSKKTWIILAIVLAVIIVGVILAVVLWPREAPVDSDAYKIALLTGTTSQSEEEFRAAERQVKADPDHIITDTYPDNFMSEQETTVSKLVAFGSDPEVKAIIVDQSVPGTKAGFDKIREMGRDDILFVACVPQEDPAVIAETADIVLYADEANQGNTIMEKCAEWGVEVFIHYSFPRHMAMELIVARHNVLTANAEALGIEFHDVTAPDPTAEAGITASQQFILEDVPQQMETYAGKKVAFFTTNCSMQEPLQTAILTQENAYYPQPCCPSPYHGFPAVLGLELEIGGSDEEALKAVATALKEHDAAGRYSTWPAPLNMILLDVGVEYARAMVSGEVTDRNDADFLKKKFEELTGGATINLYTNAEGEQLDNYYTILLNPVNFNDYL